MTTVSATVTVYNRRHIVCRAIDSILAQTRPVDEIVVVDDGSTDGSADFIEETYGDKVRVIRQANEGCAGARARCIEEARCEWLAFLDSDDTWSPDRNERMVAAIEQLPDDVPWLFGDTTEIDDKEAASLFERHGLRPTEHLQVWDDPMPTQFPFQFTLMQSSLVKREMAVEDRIFERGLKGHDDLIMGFRAASKYRIASLNEAVTQLYRTSDLSESSMELATRNTAEYFESRIIAFGTAAAAGRPGPWGALHARAVRGLCIWHPPQDTGVRRLALKQFRHVFDHRAVLFMGAAMLGKPGVEVWKHFSERRKRVAA